MALDWKEKGDILRSRYPECPALGGSEQHPEVSRLDCSPRKRSATRGKMQKNRRLTISYRPNEFVDVPVSEVTIALDRFEQDSWNAPVRG